MCGVVGVGRLHEETHGYLVLELLRVLYEYTYPFKCVHLQGFLV